MSGEPAGRVIETDLDTFAEEHTGAGVQTTRTPFAQVVNAIERTVETGAPIPGTLQQALADVMPTNRDEAQDLVKKLERFRVAAERAASVATETFYARFH